MAIGSRLRPWVAPLALALGLGGCLDSATTVTPAGSAATDTSPVRHAQASPRGAPVTFASLDGPPPALTGRFVRALDAEAAGRDIAIADPKAARYVVRGYLSAYPAADGTALAYVWDVFGKDHRLAQRVTDSVIVKGTAADPWSLMDDQALQSAAAKSADDLASFLGSTPEAMAAAPAAAADATPPGPVVAEAPRAAARPAATTVR